MTSNSAHSPLTVIDLPADCGNAPRKLVLRDFFVAFYSRDVQSLEVFLTDDVLWEFVGEATLDGKAVMMHRIAEAPLASKLSLHRILTHGTQCAVEGSVTFTEGSNQRFTHVLDFSGGAKTAKIKSIRSYEIEDRPNSTTETLG